MRILAISILLLLLVAVCGCPGNKETAVKKPVRPATTSPTVRAVTAKLKRPYPLKYIQPEEFPAEAVAYLEECLANLASREYPPKDLTFSSMGLLTGSQVGRDVIFDQVEISGEMQAPTLMMAYLAVAPEDCLVYIRRQVLAGNMLALTILGIDLDVAHWVMEHLDITDNSVEANHLMLDMTQHLKLDYADYKHCFDEVLKGDDVSARNIALGYILSIGEGDQSARETLVEAFASEDPLTYYSASESIKKSGDPYFVPVLAEYVDKGLADDGKPVGITSEKLQFVTYALTMFGGDEARELRQRLLESESVEVRWLASLGEILHGDPQHWDKLIRGASQEDTYFWSVMQAQDVKHTDLLKSIKWKAGSPQMNDRYQVMDLIQRYREDSPHETALEILWMGIDDESDLVRERAWTTAAISWPGHFTDRAIEVLQDPEEMPKVRLAATICAMRPTILRANGKLKDQGQQE